MTDESQYQKKHPKDIHIYLMPYIEADNVIILEGRNNKPLVLVSNGKIWCHQLEKITIPQNCIAPLLSKSSLLENKETNWFGICTDYPLFLKSL